MTRLGCRGPGDAGFAALSLMLGLALVVLPVAVLVLSLPVWLERAAAAQDAARLAARQVATAGNWAQGAGGARAVVEQVAVAEGWTPGTYSLSLSGQLVPGGTVSAVVSVAVPIASIPGLGAVGKVAYEAVSVAHVDTYRSSP